MRRAKSKKRLQRKLGKPKVSAASLVVQVRGQKKFLDAVKSSMLPESQKSARCIFSIHGAPDGKSLTLRFAAKDLVALRASFNTNLRLVSSALKTLESAAKVQGEGLPGDRIQKD